MIDEAFFDDRYEMEDGTDGEGAQRDAKQVFAAPDEGKDRVHETDGVQRGGHAQPDDAQFSHGAIRYYLV
jgi:hypothetical protein